MQNIESKIHNQNPVFVFNRSNIMHYAPEVQS